MKYFGMSVLHCSSDVVFVHCSLISRSA